MPETLLNGRHQMIKLDHEELIDHFADDIKSGLASNPKKIPPKYFYDHEGSLLFEQICDLPEYYLTRSESEILRNYIHDICSYLPENTELVELGSGSATKTRIIIEHLLDKFGELIYHPIDISPTILQHSSNILLNRYENLKIVSVAAEYRKGLAKLNLDDEQPKLILWLGSSIGNFEKHEAVDFMRQLVDSLHASDYFLIGIDLDKDRETLESAYDDAQGITAAFNINLLSRLNREFSANFDLKSFQHKAVYNKHKSRVEMHLESLKKQSVTIDNLNLSVAFNQGETIHTENSYKYSQEDITSLAEQSGLEMIRQWRDLNNRFSLNLFKQK